MAYGWDWNGDDTVDEWTTWYASGAPCTTSHQWDTRGTYDLKVKAKDTHDAESVWSDPLSVHVVIPGDLDGDGDVDLADLAQLLANYGTTSGATYEMGDIDGDGDVDLSDLAALLGHYGESE